MKLLKSTKGIYIAFCSLYIIVGLFLIIKPAFSVSLMSYIIGGITLAFGILRIIGYFADDPYNLTFQFDLALGIFASVIGIAFLVHPKWLLTVLPLAIGVFILINGLFLVQSSIDAKKFGLRYWWIQLIISVLASAIGVVMIFNPYKAGETAVILLGISLVISGADMLWMAIYTIKPRKQNKFSADNAVEVIYTEIGSVKLK